MTPSRFRRAASGEHRTSPLIEGAIVALGLALLCAAWLSSTSGENRRTKAAPLAEASTITVEIPPTARTMIRDWPSFFRTYNLAGLDGKCAIARNTMRGYARANGSLAFPGGTGEKNTNSITVVLKAPAAGETSAGAATDKAIDGQLAAIGCQAGE